MRLSVERAPIAFVVLAGVGETSALAHLQPSHSQQSSSQQQPSSQLVLVAPLEEALAASDLLIERFQQYLEDEWAAMLTLLSSVEGYSPSPEGYLL